MAYKITTRQTKAGTAFDLYVRWKGQRYRPLLGFNLTKDQAQEAAIAMIAKIQARPSTPEGRQDRRTLRDLVPLFWDSFTIKNRVDRARPKGILENHLLPALGDRPLAALTARDGLDYVLTRQAAGVVAGTIRREWQVLMRLVNLGVRYDWLDKNRFKAVELPDSQRRTRVAEAQELARIRLLKDRVTPEVLKELWRVIVAELNTGLREAKLLSIERAWIREETDGWWLVLPPSATKLKGTPSRIPLNASALWALRDPLPSLADGRVFRRWNDVRAFKKYWARACGLAKIQDLHFHDLRHTFATRLQGVGVDYEVRQALLGHRMPGMTATYSHGGPAWDQKLRDAVTKLDSAFKLSYGLSYERQAVVVGDPNLLKSGEPAGTRTQGPRLKRANRAVALQND
jgi:integrase